MRRVAASLGLASVVPRAAGAFATSRAKSDNKASGKDAGDAAQVAQIVEAMERDPEVVRAFVNTLSPESRRRLVLTGGAYEWFGKDSVETEMRRADVDQDRMICPKDFDNWFEEALRRKSGSTQCDEAASEKSAADAEPAQGSTTHERIAFSALCLVALEAGLPFVGFGFLDNATMILAGDAIDRTVGFYLNCSVMASAAMGNVVSGCMGMQVHGFVEKLVHRLNLPIPPLTVHQRRSQRVFLAGHIGGTIGIAVGLSLGLLPLMFIADEDEKTEQRIFAKLDVNSDGVISLSELDGALNEVGLGHKAAKAIVDKYGENGVISFEQFHKLCTELRARD